MRRFATLVAATVVALAALVGCASLLPKASPDGQAASLPVQEIAVQFATGKFIEGGGDPSARRQRAAQVRAVVLAVQAVAADNVDTTIDQLETVARAKIAAAPMESSDRLLALTLVTACAAELKSRIKSGVIKPETRVQLAQVLGWVLSVTAAYGA